MDYPEMTQELIYDELERFGDRAFQKHYNHDYYAHKSGQQKFFDSGSHFPNQPLPEKVKSKRIKKGYPESYVEEYNRSH